MNKDKIIQESKNWVEQFVIGQGLCPFAKVPYSKGQVRFELVHGDSFEEMLMAFWQEIELLDKTPAKDLSNTILILPTGVEDFEKYLDLYEIAEQLLAEQRKDEIYQLASFHPQYQFGDALPEAVSHFTNRSPYPFIHILRSDEVEEAIANYPDIDEVPKRNIETMKRLFK